MALLPTLGRTVGTGIKAVRLLVRGSVRSGAWATRRVGSARARGAANEIGMIRLFDLHAISCAGDTLIAIGLAGTIFFNVPLGEARSKVALYLLITMVPFALLAPVVGPLLDTFRHGRRYALAATMLGRAFLAYVIAGNLFGWGLYPAAFGVLALSRAYGVARSAAVPRLLPRGVGLSQVGARASVYGTFAGAVVAPIGLLAFKFGPQWPLRVAALIFVAGMVISLRLPPRADAEPPEAVPRPWRAVVRLGRREDRPLAAPLVLPTLLGSASLRLLYGFVLLFLAFAIMAGDLGTTLFGRDIGRPAAVGLIGGALAIGTFLATAAGTRLRIRRPLALQAAGLAATAGAAILAALFYNLVMVTLLALLTAVFSGVAKLAVDASIQERVPDRLRASAFGHSETVLMLAWVAGGALGIIPLPGRMGVAVAALLAVLAAARAGFVATRLHNERLSGRAGDPPDEPAGPGGAARSGPEGRPRPAEPSGSEGGPRPAGPSDGEPTDPWPDAPTVPARSGANPAPRSRNPEDPIRGGSPAAGRRQPAGRPTDPARAARRPDERWADETSSEPPSRRQRPADSTRVDHRRPDERWADQAGARSPSRGRRRFGWGRRRDVGPPAPEEPQAGRSGPAGEPAETSRASAAPGRSADAGPDGPAADTAVAPPGFHVYRPSSAAPQSPAARPPSGPSGDDETR